MDEQTYLKERLDNQINWYSSKSSEAQSWYKWLKFADNLLALLIVPISYYSDSCWWFKYAGIAAGMYVSYSDWIDYEIRTAAAMGKPILAVKPWGNERLPQIVQDSATLTVGWNSDSVVKGIKILL